MKRYPTNNTMKKYPTNNTLPLYRHKELYEWNDKYQAHKFFNEDDFKTESRLFTLCIKGREDYIRDEIDALGGSDTACYIVYDYKHRYGSLKQDTQFFYNLCAIENIVNRASSYSEAVIMCLAGGLTERMLNFWLLYNWAGGWARISIFSITEFYDNNPMLSSSPGFRKEYERYLKHKQMLYDAFHGKRHNCATVTEFIHYKTINA